MDVLVGWWKEGTKDGWMDKLMHGWMELRKKEGPDGWMKARGHSPKKGTGM